MSTRREFMHVTGAALALGPLALAQERPAVDRNSKIVDHFQKIVDDVAPQLAWDAASPEAHRAWRQKFRAQLVGLLGRSPEKTPLKFEWDETIETEAFTRRKVYIQTEPHYWAPAYVFLPKRVKGKRPAIVCLHGHSGIVPYIREGDAKTRKKSRDHQLDYAVRLAEEGYVTCALVQRGWNETAPARENGCHKMTIDSFLIGMTPVGLRVWDAMRAVDFLQTLDAVDGDRIGAAGLSGGGTTGLFFAALEDRVKLAMIAGYYCTFRDSIYTIYHCICNCVPHAMEWGEMSDIGALIDPRPLLVISGTKDPIFPIAATRRACDTLRKTYRMLGVEGDLETDFFEGHHAWNHAKVPAFLQKHFG